VYKEITDASKSIENTVNNKLGDIYRNNDIVNQELNALKNNLQSKTDSAELKGAIDKLKYSIEEKDSEQNKNINEIRSNFEAKINQQRIKYEKKLIAMEKQLEYMNKKINEMKKSPFDKFIDLLKGKSEKR
jgi:phenylalanyl-tRNA synthetase alpha subunit